MLSMRAVIESGRPDTAMVGFPPGVEEFASCSPPPTHPMEAPRMPFEMRRCERRRASGR